MKLDISTKKTMTVNEFCEEYGIGKNRAYQLVNCVNFPKIRCGKKYIIIRNMVDEWFKNQIGESF